MVWGMEIADTSLMKTKNQVKVSGTTPIDRQVYKNNNDRQLEGEKQAYQQNYRTQNPKQDIPETPKKPTFAEIIEKRKKELSEIHEDKDKGDEEDINEKMWSKENSQDSEEIELCPICNSPINPNNYAELFNKKTGQKIIACDSCAKDFVQKRFDFERNPFVEAAQDFNRRHPKLKHRVEREIACALQQNNLIANGLIKLQRERQQKLDEEFSGLLKKIEYETLQRPSVYNNNREKEYWGKQKQKLFKGKK